MEDCALLKREEGEVTENLEYEAVAVVEFYISSQACKIEALEGGTLATIL